MDLILKNFLHSKLHFNLPKTFRCTGQPGKLMKLQKYVSQEIEITEFPAYFNFGDIHVAKVTENQVIGVCYWPEQYEIGVRRYLTANDWQPCEPELFYTKFAEVSAALIAKSGIELLTVEGGAYAD